MPEFLELLPPSQALQALLEKIPARKIPVETLQTTAAAGRVTACPVFASEDLPPFTRSTVDGYAVRAADTFGAGDTLPAYFRVAGEVPMGTPAGFSISQGSAAVIHTGGMLPQGTDAVVMLEYTQQARPGEVEVLRAVAPGENVIQAGEDVRSGDQVIPPGRRLRAAEIGGLMAIGKTKVEVFQKPVTAILSSGDEVVSPDQNVLPGQIRDVNSYSLSALIEKYGGTPRRYGIIPDRPEALESALRTGLEECDLVVITAGSSASTRDLTASVIQKMGLPGVLVHGVNVRPGKPTILGICDGKPVIGLPGNPVSAFVIAMLFVIPVLQKQAGEANPPPLPVVQARLEVNIPSQAGREDWMPVILKSGTNGLTAEPIFYKSNLIFTLAKASGLLRIPADANGMPAGVVGEVWLL